LGDGFVELPRGGVGGGEGVEDAGVPVTHQFGNTFGERNGRIDVAHLWVFA